MYTDILINATSYENRIALVENGHLREFNLERVSEKKVDRQQYLPGSGGPGIAEC